jgi:glycine oxidase
MHDVLVVGGGVIGLSLAWDLARHGQSVHVIDRGQPGREASWAGAGILPPANRAAAIHPYDQLCGMSAELHPQWARELTAFTGIDTGYRPSGGLYLARTAGEAASLAAWAADQSAQGITANRLSQQELAILEPGLRGSGGRGSRRAEVLPSSRMDVPQPPLVAFLLPDEAQIRNPRHLQALIAACRQTGIEITADVAADRVAIGPDQLQGIDSSRGLLRAHRYCFTAGAWTGQLLAQLGLSIAVLPLRGQMVLFRCQSPPIRHILNEGSRYIVPRDDGLVLAGSTEEEVGFDKRTTDEAIADLAAFARELVPALADAPIEQTWAGLRPASFDGLPYLGQLPGVSNAFIAAGHFRSGLFLSPATAVVMSQLVRGEKPAIDLAPFRVGR